MSSQKTPRRCWRCPTWQEIYPTEQIKNNHRVWVCPVCGTKTSWVLDPDEEDGVAERHRLPGGGFSVVSMLSDPDCRVYSPKQRAEVGRPVGFLPPSEITRKAFCLAPTPATPNPTEYAQGTLVFIFDAQGNRTHRWHWGRGAWIKINQK